MNKNIKIALVGALLTSIILSGCSGGETSQEAEKTAVKNLAANVSVSSKEDTQIKKLISDYFVAMYSESVENCQENTEKGLIPKKLETYIAKRTIEEGNNNIEVGLNLPRYVGLNGYTLISYEPIMEYGSKDKTQIESTFIEGSDGDVLYYSKVSLKAECVLDDIFKTKYKLNSTTNTYKKNAEISKDNIDEVAVQAKFDVKLVKEGSSYKILWARESTYKQGVKNRMFKYNNDFISRLSYLDLTKSDDNTGYKNKEDGEIYKKETGIITSFFNNISNLDTERRTLLRGSWNSNYADFNELMNKMGITKDKDKKDILNIDDYYNQKLPKEALLLRNDINKVKIKELRIDLHPAYSKLNKWYIVTFNAQVEKTSGIVGFEQDYQFDFLIKLTDKDNSLRIDSIKLNNMSEVLKEVASETTTNAANSTSSASAETSN